jgi:hypothetical protein
LMPPAVQRSNAKHYKSNTITEIKEFPGRSHLMPAQKGWEEIADYALAWAEEHARRRSLTSCGCVMREHAQRVISSSAGAVNGGELRLQTTPKDVLSLSASRAWVLRDSELLAARSASPIWPMVTMERVVAHFGCTHFSEAPAWHRTKTPTRSRSSRPGSPPPSSRLASTL